MTLTLDKAERRPPDDDWNAPEGGVICAFAFRAGAAAPVEAPDPAPPVDADWTWTHLRLGDVRAVAWVRRIEDLPAKALQLFRVEEDRIQIDQAGDWVFGVLPDFERDLGGEAQGEGRLAFAFDGRRLVTGRLHALLAIDDLRHAAASGEALAGPAAAILRLVELYVTRAEDLLEARGTELASFEDYVLTAPSSPRERPLTELRRAVARQRRELQALRSALARATTSRHGRRIERLGENVRDLIAWLEDSDHAATALQERGRLLHEEIDTLINAATNRSMRVLTVISTLLIPPTLIVGAFGMNVPGIPWEHSRAGFWIASGLCVVVVAGAFWMLRRLS
ncbi:MAG TPA: CorA family divalent cation transporter [Caulobacteraceae bacterium]|jgi:zinc transporter|nr:CorA family divalent cation transporter [Caulobacteraceae bacterium]